MLQGEGIRNRDFGALVEGNRHSSSVLLENRLHETLTMTISQRGQSNNATGRAFALQ